MWTSRTPFTAAAVAVLAVACGGGGDGGGDVGPQPPTYVLISSANQDAVARASFASIMPFLSVPVVPTAAQGSPPVYGGLAQLALRPVRSGIGTPTQAPAGTAQRAMQYRVDYQCRVSGTMTYIWDDKDNSTTPTAGDSVSMSFNQCVDAPGVVFNGGLGMTLSTYSATSVAEDMTGSMTFQSLTMADQYESYSMEGNVAFHLNVTETADSLEMFSNFVVGSDGMRVAKRNSADGSSDAFSYRVGFAVSDRDFGSKVPGVPSWEVITASGNFGSQSLGGDLGLTTATPFKSVFTEATLDIYPLEGQLFASGHNNTRLGVGATGTNQVRIDLCDDGDNTWEATKMVTWDWLLP